MTASRQRPLILHVIHRLDTGGLENGLVNLINRLPEQRFRHAIACMTDFTDFRQRIERSDVEIVALNKRPGLDPGAQVRLYQTIRRLRPNIVHGRNLAALDGLLPARLAGVRACLHGEHGRDESDPDGRSSKRLWLRRLHAPLVSHFSTVSDDLRRYLIEGVGIAASRVTRIYNGVDTQRFAPAMSPYRSAFPSALRDPRLLIFGVVGRLQAVKDVPGLVQAFAIASRSAGSEGKTFRLVVVGEGPERLRIEAEVRRNSLDDQVVLLGERSDIPRLAVGFDVFVMGSIAEGISNTLLEAMACGLPVIATRVGGNPELVEAERTGLLVPRQDPQEMARAMSRYAHDAALRAQHGAAGRERAERQFSLDAMTRGYLELYERYLLQGGR